MTQYFNLSESREQRRNLRRTMPSAEVILWSKLKGRQLLGYKFRRQFGIGSYSIDFYCAELLFAIELDGDTHYAGDAPAGDRTRQTFIESFGIKSLRIINDEVYENLNGVWDGIARAVTMRREELRKSEIVGRRVRSSRMGEEGTKAGRATPPNPPFLRGGK